MNYTYKDHTYKNYDEASKAVLAQHRKMMDDFNEKYPSLSNVADTLLYPDSTFQVIFDGLDKAAVSKEIKCPGAPLRKQVYPH